MNKSPHSYRRTKIRKLLSCAENQSLNCQFQDLTDEDFYYLIKEAKTPIQKLHLRQNFITSKGILALKNIDYKRLIVLDLKSNLIRSNGAKFLSSLVLPNLKTVSLQNNCIGNQGVVHLAKCQWKNLQEINLSSNLIRGNSISILSIANWKNIKCLNLNLNKIRRPNMLELIKSQWDHCKVIRAINEQEYESRQSSVKNMEILFQQKFFNGHNIEFYLFY